MDRTGEGTTFTIDRKIFSSDIWFSSPWKLKIWIYLLGHANHKDNTFMGQEIKRGQLIRSLRTIQDDCSYKIGYRTKKPSLDTVRRVCEALTKELRIEQRTVHTGTMFTVCNYNNLQPKQKQRTEQRTDTSSYNDRTMTVQDKNDKNVKNNNNCPQKEIVDLWHEVLFDLPGIKIWDDTREGNLRSRWRMDEKYQSLDWWRGFFEYIRTCPFLMGEVEPVPGRKQFRATLPWVVIRANFLKIIEGNYKGG